MFVKFPLQNLDMSPYVLC